jgi:HupE/UreJ protein
MSKFGIYLKLGFGHILDISGYDHILFVIALCAVYAVSDWKRVLILVTAFTIGHSITLALATVHLIDVNRDLIEFLIPVTIFITSMANLFKKKSYKPARFQSNYFFAIFFGLIHGLGFSNYLRSLLGEDTTILNQLLAFNIGLELGQIIIVAFFMAISFIFVGIFNVSKRDWNLIVSSGVAAIAITLIIETRIW